MKKLALALTLAVALTPLSSLTLSASSAKPAEPPMELTFVSWNCGAITEDNWAVKKLNQALNVKIKTLKVDLSQAQQRDLMIASGEMPDFAWIIAGVTPQGLFDQGVTRTIPVDMVKKHAPNYAKVLDAEPLGWKININKKDSNFLSLSGWTEKAADSATFMATYRLDWLEKLGIKVPGELIPLDDSNRLFFTKESFKRSEFTKILEGFTNGDPDGNGQKDTIGASLAARTNFFWSAFYSMFDFAPVGSMEVNGRAENYYVTDKYKEFLKYVADLYAKGYLDKEYATLDQNKAWEKYAGGKIGYAGTMAAWVGPVSFAALRPPNVTLTKTTNGKMLVAPLPVDDNGKGGPPPYSDSNYSRNLYVNKKVSDTKLAKILEVFDYMNFDKDAMIYLRYGEEGTHFTYTGADKKSSPVLKEGVTNGGAFGLGVYNSNYIAPLSIQQLGWVPETKQLMEYSFGDYAKRLIYPYKSDMLNETKLASLTSKYGSTINTLVDEYFHNVISGELKVDSSWSNYINNLNKSGYKEISDELQNAPLYKDLVK